MTKQDYIQRVLLIMNEAGLYDKDGNSFVGADAAQVDRYIEGSYVDAWRRCATVMPKAWFKNVSFSSETHTPNTVEGIGFVVLPEDFYLLNSFKMTSWRKAIYDVYIENERTSSIQSNEYTRGSQIRPVATISTKMVGGVPKQVLNYYSVPKGTQDTIEEAIYIPVAEAIKDAALTLDLELDHRIIEPMAYLSASSVFTIFEKYDIAKALEQRVIEMFPAFKSLKGTNVTFKQ